MGREIALALARKGHDIAVVDVRDDWGQQAVEAIKKETGQKAAYVKTDISKRSEVETMAATVVRELGRIDVLVNNAAIVKTQPIERMTDELLEQMFAINFRGTVLCCQAVIEPMRRQKGGRIVNIGSAVTAGPTPPLRGLGLYAATKGAAMALTKVLALELAPDNIMVTMVAPGFMHTAQGSEMPPTEEDFKRGRRQLMGRPLYPAEVAEVVVYAATCPSHAITGQTIHANGGVILV
jgi:NAD(P)-dependent dehydrogenase (short-subunit alcohol dehydrogenase family)